MWLDTARFRCNSTAFLNTSSDRSNAEITVCWFSRPVTAVTQNHGDSPTITAHDQNHGKIHGDRKYVIILTALRNATSGHAYTSTMNLVSNYLSIRKKPIKNLEEKGAYPCRDCPIFWVSPLSQERVKLRTSNFVSTFTGSTRTKAR